MVQVVLLAMDAARSALRTLQHTSAVLDIHEYRIKAAVRKKTSVEPVAPETPQLLPTIHALWSPLVQSLKVPAMRFSCNTPCVSSIAHSCLMTTPLRRILLS